MDKSFFFFTRVRAPSSAARGVRDADDIRAAKAAGCGGAVLGKALLEGRLQLDEALSC